MLLILACLLIFLRDRLASSSVSRARKSNVLRLRMATLRGERHGVDLLRSSVQTESFTSARSWSRWPTPLAPSSQKLLPSNWVTSFEKQLMAAASRSR